MEQINYNGFRAKTVNIRTYTGATKFTLQKSNELGLPKDCIVVGIMVRQHSSTKIASNNKPLVDDNVFENAFLSLKSYTETDGMLLFLDKYYLPLAMDKTLFFEPQKAINIDWNESFITINKRAASSLVDDTFIELTILYREFENNICELPNCFTFRTGVKLLGTRRKNKDLPLLVGETEVPLSNTTNLGIPRNAWVVGFSTRNTGFPYSGDPMDLSAFYSTYLTLKRKTDCFIESFPVELENYQDTLFPDIDYFPIEPVKVLDLDWESSKLDIKNVAGIKKGQVFPIEFIYVMADSNKLLTTSM